MFGDYYTNDLISGSPNTNMLGNEINLFVQGGTQKNLGASLVLVLMIDPRPSAWRTTCSRPRATRRFA